MGGEPGFEGARNGRAASVFRTCRDKKEKKGTGALGRKEGGISLLSRRNGEPPPLFWVLG